MSDSWRDIKQRLDPLNISRGVFKSDNDYGIPSLSDDGVDPASISKLIPFGVSRKRNGTCHFFIEDYRFQRVFTHSKRYLNMFEQFESVMTPDFSVYSDYPLAAQIWNIYRNRWCGCFWQQYGIKVIPTVSWAGEESFDFCFLGIPEKGTVAVSNVGVQYSEQARKDFLKGYNAMLDTLKPKHIIFYGKLVDDLDGDITFFEQFTDKFKKGE